MALGIHRAIGAVAVELVRRLLDDRGAGGLRPGVMGVDVAPQLNVNLLAVLAAERLGAARDVRPFARDHDGGALELHLGVHDLARVVADDQRGLEAEGLGQPFERGAVVLIDDGGPKDGCVRIGHGGYSLLYERIFNRN